MIAALVQVAPILFILAVCVAFNMPNNATPGRWWDA